MTPIEDQAKYWNKTWGDRIVGNKVSMNGQKIHIVINALWKRFYMAPMEKLDIGCGSGIHAANLAVYNPLWQYKWTGIDLAETGVSNARRCGLNAICGDFFTFDGNGKKYELFLLLDSLEHFEDPLSVGRKIKELASDRYIIFGNCPLYLGKGTFEAGVEFPINIWVLKQFMEEAGCLSMNHHIYGINGFPYILFEGSNQKVTGVKWFTKESW